MQFHHMASPWSEEHDPDSCRAHSANCSPPHVVPYLVLYIYVYVRYDLCTCIRYLLRSYTDRIYYCEPLSLLFETRAALRHTHRPRHRLYITSNISIHTHRPDRDLSRARPVRVTESPWTDKLYCPNLLSLS